MRALYLLFISCISFNFAYIYAENLISYPVSGINLSYAQNQAGPIAIDEFYDIPVTLSESNGLMYGVAEFKEGIVNTYKIKDLNQPKHQMTSDALVAVAQEIVRYCNDHGFIGVFVGLKENQIAEDGTDLRGANENLEFVIQTAKLTNLNVKSANRSSVNPTLASHLIAVFPTETGCDSGHNDLNIQVINDYLFRMNRYPNRMIGTEIAAFAPDGSVELDLLVHEDSAWRGYVNVENTGTSSTGHWIERVGYTNYQLTHHDDTLSVEYVTATFNHMHAGSFYYEAPCGSIDRLRFRLDAWKSTFDVQPLEILQTEYEGDQWQAGGGLIALIYQNNDLFIDMNVMWQWLHVYVNNNLSGLDGKEKFIIPSIGFSLSRKRVENVLYANVSYQKNLPNLAGTHQDGLVGLGRPNTNANWAVLSYNFFGSTYFNTQPHYDDNRLWLVNEVALTLGGQYAFDYRLIPQKEGTIGGLYTIRGYDQGLVAADSLIFFQAEYRRHIPRGTLCTDCPKFFGNRDWDFFARAFVDGGHTHFNRAEEGETNYTLYSTGVGAEFVWKKNLVLRMDAGLALSSIWRGTGRVNFSGTFLF